MKVAKRTHTAGSPKRALAAIAVVGALALGLTGCKGFPGEATRDRVEWDHNVARTLRGVPSLGVNSNAQNHAQHAADRLRYESGDRGCTLRHTYSRDMDTSYPGLMWGENIGCYPGCTDAADDATPEFLESPTHRNILLSLLYHGFGVGVSCNDNYLFVAVHFVA